MKEGGGEEWRSGGGGVEECRYAKLLSTCHIHTQM